MLNAGRAHTDAHTDVGRRPGSGRFVAELRIPEAPRHHVPRPRLFELLDESLAVPLTAVVAPAGSGKTVLLSGWARAAPVPVAWLGLDDADVDGVSFWTGVIEALNSKLPSVGSEAQRCLDRATSLGEVVAQLVEELERALAAPIVLVIDDVHLVDHHRWIVDSLGLFLRHLPLQLHVVLSSRHELRLPLDRLRARGQLGEVGFGQLHFSSAESTAMLTSLIPSLSVDEAGGLARRADGWAAGLRLAALEHRAARARAGEPASTASEQHLVDDYVMREVLAAEDPALVALLRDVSVVDRVNVDLAGTLSRSLDAGLLLAQAESRGLFLSRLGTSGWWVLHAAVRAVLLSDLEHRDPERLAECRLRAAQWLEDSGQVVEALEQWRLAGEHRAVLRLLAEHQVQLYETGSESIIRDVIAAIPPDVATADLGSLVDLAWCLVLVDRRRFLDVVEQATWWAARDVEAIGSDTSTLAPPLASPLTVRLAVLHSIANMQRGDWTRSSVLARAAVDDRSSTLAGDPIGQAAWNVLAHELALDERWDDDSDEVRELAWALRRDPSHLIGMEATRALGESLAGRPVDALRVAAGVRSAAAARGMTTSMSELAIAEAIAHREIGERERARVSFEELVDLELEPMTHVRVLASLELVLSHLEDGDTVAARRTFDRSQALARAESPGADVRTRLARVGTTLAVAAGDVTAARQWCGQNDDPFWGVIGDARVHLASGDRAAARASAELAVPRCPRHDVVLALVRARAAPDHDEAVKWAGIAAEQAMCTGLLQTVAAEGPAVMDLIERTGSLGTSPWMDRLRRAVSNGQHRAGAGPGHLVEPLTARERDVLRFLPSRLTIREIADELYVSVNTLKFHLKVIYRKLGVGSRAEATAIVRTWTSVSKESSD